MFAMVSVALLSLGGETRTVEGVVQERVQISLGEDSRTRVPGVYIATGEGERVLVLARIGKEDDGFGVLDEYAKAIESLRKGERVRVTLTPSGRLRKRYGPCGWLREAEKLSFRPKAGADSVDPPDERADTGVLIIARGTVLGVVSKKGDRWIEVASVTGRKARYIPEWRGGMPNQGGGPDREVLEQIHGTNVGDRVAVTWVVNRHLRVLDIRPRGKEKRTERLASGAAVITLKSGHRFLGKVLEADEKKVRVRTAFATLELRRSQIKSIEGPGGEANAVVSLFRADFEDRDRTRWSMGRIVRGERGSVIAGVMDEGRLRVRSNPQRVRFKAGRGLTVRFRYFVSGPREVLRMLLCGEEEMVGAVIPRPVSGRWQTAELRWSEFRGLEDRRKPAAMDVGLLNWFLTGATEESRFLMDDIEITGPREEAPVLAVKGARGFAPVEKEGEAAEAWTAIFNGRDLKGWEQGGGKAYVEERAVVSEDGADLFYAADWAEFVLDCELKAAGGEGVILSLGLAHTGAGRGNSRVRIRFHADGDAHICHAERRLEKSGTRKFPLGDWTRVRVELTLGALKLYKDDALVASADLSDVPAQKGGVFFNSHGDSAARMRNVRVRLPRPREEEVARTGEVSTRGVSTRGVSTRRVVFVEDFEKGGDGWKGGNVVKIPAVGGTTQAYRASKEASYGGTDFGLRPGLEVSFRYMLRGAGSALNVLLSGEGGTARAVLKPEKGPWREVSLLWSEFEPAGELRVRTLLWKVEGAAKATMFYLDDVTVRFAPPSVENLLARAREREKRGDWRGAASLYAAAYELDPDAEVAHKAAVAWSKLGEKKKAMLWQEKAKNFWDAAQLAQSLGLHGWAREYYGQEAELGKNRKEPSFRGRIMERKRRVEEIHKTFRDEGWIAGRVAGKNPKNSVVRVLIEQTPEGREILAGLTMPVCTNWVNLGHGWQPKPQEVKVLRALNLGDRVRVDFYWEGHYRFRKIEKE